MGRCIYCEQKAGFFAKSHKECEKKYQHGINLILEKASKAFSNPLESNFKEICDLSNEAYIKENKRNEVLANV